MQKENKKGFFHYILSAFRFRKRRSGFSMIEAVVGIMLAGVAMMGLAQLFTYGVLINSRADKISNATFLAQEQTDMLRSLTSDELVGWTATLTDEAINTNNDAIIDYRRITEVQVSGQGYKIRVRVFPGDIAGIDADTLFSNPQDYRVMADVSTNLSR